MGITLDQMIFDPSNPDDGANVGATLRGADGTVIGNTGDAIKVDMVNDIDVDIRDLAFATDKVDVTGSEVALDAATLAALENVTVSATDLDIRDLTFATDKVDASGSEVSLDAATLAALETVTVTATDLDIRNLLFATDKVDVTGSSVTASATDFDIRDLVFATDKVDVSGSDITAAVTFALTDTIHTAAQTITTTASQLIASPQADRTSLLIQNLGSKSIYIGEDNTVSSLTGVVIPTGGSAEFPWGPTIIPWAITASSSADVRMLETS